MGLAAGVNLSDPQTPQPLHTVYVYQYTHSHREGGGELNQREGERGNSSQSRVENTNMADCMTTFCFVVHMG